MILLLRDVLKPLLPIYIIKMSVFAIFIFLPLPLFFTSISTPKQPKPTPLRLNALFDRKNGYLSGYLSQIYLFSCILDKECLYLATH